MHDEIIRYHLNGTISDGDIVKTRERMVEFVEGQMREGGCVPSLDLEPQFTLNYQPEEEAYEFSLTVYGVFVGGEAWRSAGMMNGKTIILSTPKAK